MSKKQQAEVASLASRMKELREAAGISIHALAKLAGISHQQLYRIESGERSCTWETACKLADGLGVKLDELR